MMAKRGRPKLPARLRKGSYVGFRATDALRRQIATAAADNGRSLSQEAAARLEQSFRDDQVMGAIALVRADIERIRR